MSHRLPRLEALLALLSLALSPLHAQPMVVDGAFAPSVEYEYDLVRATRYLGVSERKLIAFGHPSLTRINDVPVSHAIARLLPTGALDTAFAAQLLPGDIVREAVTLPDGRLIVTTQSLDQSNPSRVVRLLTTGQTDPTFTPLALSASSTARLTLLSDGSVIVWGSFNSIGGVPRNSLARVLTDGQVDAGYAPALADALYVSSAIATTNDRIILSGQSFAATGPNYYYFCRLSPTGAIDPTFAPTVPSRTFSFLARLSDDRLLVSDSGIRLLKADGSIDASFSPPVPGLQNIRQAVLLPGDRLAVEAATPDQADSALFILKPDGTLERDDRNLPGAERIQSLACVLSDGTVAFVQGPMIWTLAPWTEWSTWYIPGMADPRLCLFNPTAGTITTLPTTVHGGTPSSVSRLSLDSAGRILAEGNFTRIAGVRRAGYARFNLDGTLDSTFDPVAVFPLLHLPDGRIIGTRRILGPADADGFHAYATSVVRLNTEGMLDPTFTPPSDLDLVNATWLTTAPDGQMLVCAFDGGRAQANAKLIWLTAAGLRASTLSTTFADSTFSTSSTAPTAVQSAVVAPDGKLLLCVRAEKVNGVPSPRLLGSVNSVLSDVRLVRLNADGTTDSSFHPSGTALRDVTGVKLAPDGRVYLYGNRGQLGAILPSSVLRLNPDGSPDTFVDLARIDGLPLSDGSYLYHSSRYRADGSRDLNFRFETGYSYSDSVFSAVLARDGSLWLGGLFSSVNDQPRNGLARLVPAEVAGFTVQPQNAHAFAGSAAMFQAEIGTAAAAIFQWTFNGAPVAGATNRVLRLEHAATTAAGEYRLVATVGGSTYTSEPATLTIDPNTARLVNFSARCAVSPAYPPQIGGFVLREAAPRSVLLRAVGRGLPLDNPGFTLLPEPHLRVLRGTNSLAEDAGGALAPALAEVTRQVGAFPLRSTYPPNDPTRDSALLLDLPAGAYTAQVNSHDGRSGVSLFEFYDAATTNDTSAAANVSIRGRAAPGDDVLIAGFVVGGRGLVRLLIRGIGPGLAPFGVTGALADPRLTLFRQNTELASNDNWNDQVDVPDLAAAAQHAGAFALPTGSRDAAMLVTLEPGIYTVHGSAADNSGGEMLIELYLVEY